MSVRSGLPEGWTIASLGSVADSIIGGGTPPRKEASNFGGEIVWLTPTEIPKSNVTVIADSRERLTDKGIASSSASWIPENSVLLTSRASIGFVAIAGTKLTTNQGFASFVLPSGIEPRFLAWWLKYQKGRLEQLAGGTTFKEISKGTLREVQAPIPPSNEQRRIVAAIEEQFSRLDAGVSALERVRTNLKRYRTAVLKAAVEGRLTETWREEKPNVEPASELLERILKERREQWEKNQLAAYEKKGKKTPKNWRSKYKEPSGPVEDLPQLPVGWIWSTLEQLTWHSGYGTSQKCGYEAPGPPVLRIPNIAGGSFDLSDLKFGSRPAEFESIDSLAPNDMLVVRTNGSRNLIGRAAVVRGELERPYYFASYLIRFRVVGIPGLPEWLATAWDAPSTRRHIEHVAATSAGQCNVNISKLNNVPIPLPPLGEQTAVVEEVKLRRSVLDEVEAEVVVNMKRATHLRQSILKRAFEGKLVPQDPADEPASELLARIRAERERSNSANRRKKTPARHEPAEAQAGLF